MFLVHFPHLMNMKICKIGFNKLTMTHFGPIEVKFCILLQRRPSMPPLDRSQAESNIAIDILLTVLTCGLYGLFWQARIFKTVNSFLDQEKHKFWTWLLLCLLTCGLYNIYAQYELARSINGIQASRNMKVNENLVLLDILFSIIAFHFLSNAFNQAEINAWFD